MDLDQLHAELAKARQIAEQVTKERDLFKSKFDAIQNPAFKHETSLFLKKLPIEIRNHVYENLLCNEVLSQWQSIDRNHTGYGLSTVVMPYDEKYDLSPAILTCRQIYEEASLILYGSNTFNMDCTYSTYVRSPLLRTFKSGYGTGSHLHDISSLRVLKIDVFKKVKRLKVMLAANKRFGETYPFESLANLCKAIHQNPMKAINLLIIPQRELFRPDGEDNPAYVSSYHKLQTLLQPL